MLYNHLKEEHRNYEVAVVTYDIIQSSRTAIIHLINKHRVIPQVKTLGQVALACSIYIDDNSAHAQRIMIHSVTMTPPSKLTSHHDNIAEC